MKIAVADVEPLVDCRIERERLSALRSELEHRLRAGVFPHARLAGDRLVLASLRYRVDKTVVSSGVWKREGARAGILAGKGHNSLHVRHIVGMDGVRAPAVPRRGHAAPGLRAARP